MDEFDQESRDAATLGARTLAQRLYAIPTTSEAHAETIILAARLLLDQAITFSVA